MVSNPSTAVTATVRQDDMSLCRKSRRDGAGHGDQGL